MAENSKIEWTKHTLNLWWGCTEVHAGCENCYAETLAKRWGFDVWGDDKPRRAIKNAMNELVRFQQIAAKANRIDPVFVGSMMDIFEKSMPLLDHKGTTGELRDFLFTGISAGFYNNLMFLFLTKRVTLINKLVPEEWLVSPPPNVFFGTSISDQATADRMVPELLKVNGKKFLSVEPQLDFIDLTRIKIDPLKWSGDDYLNSLTGTTGNSVKGSEKATAGQRIHWVIQGGESGPGKRPFDLSWAYAMREQCEISHTPYFFKQIDKVQQIPEDLKIQQFPRFI